MRKKCEIREQFSVSKDSLTRSGRQAGPTPSGTTAALHWYSPCHLRAAYNSERTGWLGERDSSSGKLQKREQAGSSEERKRLLGDVPVPQTFTITVF